MTSRLSDDQSPGYGVDRNTSLSFTLDGAAHTGVAGDTIASALVASGELGCGPSLYLGRPRGIMAAGVEEPNALLHLAPRSADQPAESMLPATTVSLVDGLEASWLQGLGRLDDQPDGALYDRQYVHTDVLVVGAGPAGLAAAAQAAATGARTMLIDDQPMPGGWLLGTRGEVIDGLDAVAWAQRTIEEARAAAEFTYLPRTTAFGSYDANYVVALENRTDHLPAAARPGVSRQRIWHIRAAEVVLATGAHERPLMFAENDRPGIMLAESVRTYLNRYAALAGEQIVIATTNDAVYSLVEDLVDAGVPPLAVVDSRPDASQRAADVLQATGARGIFGAAVTGTDGDAASGRVTAVTVHHLDADGVPVGSGEQVSADLLAVSGGHSPVVHLHSQRQGSLSWDESLAAFIPSAPVAHQQSVGAMAGTWSLDAALRTGAEAGRRAAEAYAFQDDPGATPAVPSAEGARADLGYGPVRPLWLTGAPGSQDPAEWTTHFVDFQRDQTVADALRAVGAGMHSVEHVKRYTSISTAHDQGRTSAVNTVGLLASVLGAEHPGEIGTTGFRAPYTPVAFAALAGRRRGELFDPARITNIHSWHESQGAVFEDVGQWKRPRYYPRAGEDMETAVLRECAAARESVGFQDVSTLGKIEIRGTDTGEFLNRIYTNAFAKLPVGKGRYGLMCTPDGMIFDDGVTLRIAEDRFLMTTTSGSAAKVLDWLEEWHQTEWPELDVVFTSVTEQWNTVAVVGPKSREVIARIAPDLDVSNEAFGFMAFRETTLSNGIPARICRVSFSGELAFEVNVANYYGLAAWELIAEAGEPFDITPYGTETMHVLRAEKGLIIVGQDTDGTVTPQDAGMEWAVSKTKDFIGRRSYSRPDTAREDRKHLVGVLPVDGKTLLPEGAQLVAEQTPLTPQDAPVPMLGHVTSSYRSAALGRPFGLALVWNGRNRIGETVRSPVGDQLVDVEITSHVLFDPEGARRDG
ncbi:glycine cleavage T C-terminal barrel domain-containing protein [Nesterenkonia aerolata]|uniref:Sarcosine oxidase subunit alpha n=1 Tax=Nesterenkonia aerolata TaxID=3074079 RepID=A0ABU2DUU3_9MICC|nr:2Fe-2S iron-sulfur cluster-binding protein [Nesterenkonia sp. LY-0111]MDR8020284.1 glycine cleavage T C-terminal barrel domain-containing protein [Nesterenkonia sp. LY-0111]